jgi:hypothetical protein
MTSLWEFDDFRPPALHAGLLSAVPAGLILNLGYQADMDVPNGPPTSSLDR